MTKLECQFCGETYEEEKPAETHMVVAHPIEIAVEEWRRHIDEVGK